MAGWSIQDGEAVDWINECINGTVQATEMKMLKVKVGLLMVSLCLHKTFEYNEPSELLGTNFLTCTGLSHRHMGDKIIYLE